MACEAKPRERFNDPGWDCDGTDLVVVTLGPERDGVRIPVVAPRSRMAELDADVRRSAFNFTLGAFTGGDHYHLVMGEKRMGRGIIWIHEEALASLLSLRGDERVLGVTADTRRGSIGVMVEGPRLPDHKPGTYPADLPLDDRVDLHLPAKLRALLARYDGGKHGVGWEDFARHVDRILNFGEDPREMMPPGDVPPAG